MLARWPGSEDLRRIFIRGTQEGRHEAFKSKVARLLDGAGAQHGAHADARQSRTQALKDEVTPPDCSRDSVS